MVKRGDVWRCALDPTTGREIRKTRPCLVVSPDDLNRALSTVIVAPLTSGSQPARFRTPVCFLGRNGLILPDQIRTLDKQRLLKHLGTVEEESLESVLNNLKKMFSV